MVILYKKMNLQRFSEADGHLTFDTQIDTKGVEGGMSKLGGIMQQGLGVLTGNLLTKGVESMKALGESVMEAGMSFETGMSRVQAISGASAENMELLSDKAKEMGANTKFSASEAADAMNYMAMAGWKTEDMLGGIEGIMNLAAASGEDLALTSDIVTDALTAFGLTAEDSTHFADVLAAASSNANTNVAMMGETFKYVGSVAGSLGYEVEDMATAIGLMANAGIKGSQAGTSLRSLLTRMAKPTKEVQQAMETLGISLTDESGQMKDFAVIMDEMRAGFAGLSEAEKAQVATMLAGKNAMSGVLAIVNASAEDYEKLTGAINNADGAAESMAETMQDNLAGQITIMKSAMEGLQIALYEGFAQSSGGLTNLVHFGTDAINALTEGFQEGGVGGLVEAGGKVIADMIKGFVTKIPDMINTAKDLILSFASGLKAGIPDIIAAGGELVDTLQGMLVGLFDDLPDMTSKGMDLIASFAEGMIKKKADLAAKAAEVIGDIGTYIQDNAPALIQKGADIITHLIQGISDTAPSLMESAGNIIGTIISTVVAVLPSLVTAGIQIIGAIVSGIIQNLPALMETAGGIINNFVSYVMENGPALIQTGVGLLLNLISGIVSALPALVETALVVFSSFLDNILQHLPDLISAGVELLANLVGGILNALPQIAEAAAEIIKSLVGKIGDKAPDIIKAGVDMLKNLISGIHDNLPELAKKAGEMIGTVLKTIIAALPDIIAAGGKILGSLIGGIISMIPELPKILGTVVSTIWNFLTSIDWLGLGGQIISAIGNGIVAGLKGIWEGLTGVLGGREEKKTKKQKQEPETGGDYPYRGGGGGYGGSSYQLSDDTMRSIAAANQYAYSTTNQASGATGTDIDYDRMANAMANSMSGVRVTMDGREVGTLTAPYVDSYMGQRTVLASRGAR